LPSKGGSRVTVFPIEQVRCLGIPNMCRGRKAPFDRKQSLLRPKSLLNFIKLFGTSV